LIEMGLNSLCDMVWLVTVDKDTQLKRLMERDNYTYEEANNRIMAQTSDKNKLNYADVVIDNNGTLEDLKKKVVELWNKL